MLNSRMNSTSPLNLFFTDDAIDRGKRPSTTKLTTFANPPPPVVVEENCKNETSKSRTSAVLTSPITVSFDDKPIVYPPS